MTKREIAVRILQTLISRKSPWSEFEEREQVKQAFRIAGLVEKESQDGLVSAVIRTCEPESEPTSGSP